MSIDDPKHRDDEHREADVAEPVSAEIMKRQVSIIMNILCAFGIAGIPLGAAAVYKQHTREQGVEAKCEERATGEILSARNERALHSHEDLSALLEEWNWRVDDCLNAN